MKCLLILFSLFVAMISFADEYTIEQLPIQDAGRVKPLATVAQESLQLVYGKSKYQGQSAIRIYTTWLLLPDAWYEKEVVTINHHGLKESLKFDKDQKFFSPKDLLEHPRLNVLFSDLAGRVAKKEKLTPYYQAVQRLEAQVLTFVALKQGTLRAFPPQTKEQETNWTSLADLKEPHRENFFKILSSYAASFTAASDADKESAKASLKEALATYTAAASQHESYPSSSEMSREVHYQKLQPFLWTWILYLLSAIILSLSFLVTNKRPFILVGAGAAALGFALHTYGFLLRVLITGRPPVANMYETVIWVGFGVMLFAGIFSFLKKRPFILIAGGVVATFCMVVADMAPVILDPSLQPLEPVLRSNMWLIIHVMTITLSYAAFFLAFGVGDYGIFLIIKDEKKNKAKIRELSQTCYHIMQVGVVLLAAGTILGGVWADYSWGRFWGWDPKETWAFIALMGYIALLHARLTGWVKEFGMLAGSIVAFSLVIMAWYGVNYVLGAGLHSYGFGAGGIEYVSGFVIIHLIYVGYAALVKSRA